MDIQVISELARDLKDPRKRVSRIKYTVTQILTITLMGVLAGCEDWHEIEEFGKAHIDYLRKFFPDLKKTPSHDTFERFFSLLKPKAFERAFRIWVSRYFPKPQGTICIDGKAVRGAAKNDPKYKNSKDPSPVDVVSVWCKDLGISFGQLKVSEKSNEIPAIPKLISGMDFSGCVVTADAMGCQKRVVEAIRKTNADYVIACKGNQEALCESVKTVFENMEENLANVPDAKNWYHSAVYENKGHGRQEKREITTFGQPGQKPTYFASEFETTKDWKDICSLVKMRSTRTIISTGETSTEDRFYISSLLPFLTDRIAKSVRDHWSIENQLHWQLDVTFGEDAAKRIRNAALNFSLINKIALSIVKRYKEKKDSRLSMKVLRKRIGWNIDTLSELLELAVWS